MFTTRIFLFSLSILSSLQWCSCSEKTLMTVVFPPRPFFFFLSEEAGVNFMLFNIYYYYYCLF